MPKYFCDYCDVYLTHDSMSVRKAHNSGRNHLRNVVDYYQAIGQEKAQSVIDSITASGAIGEQPDVDAGGTAWVRGAAAGHVWWTTAWDATGDAAGYATRNGRDAAGLPATTEWLPARYARHATSALPATDSGHGRLATSGSTIPSSEYAILARLRAAEWWGPDEPATEYDAGYASRYAAGNEWDEAGESVMAASVK
ncbi:U1 small nuclear ribonucleoprotein C [Friedmanniomyces endolithicus]|nr:U1 small nuclear ribonucleoprotein C [Friedmanniomyces endolithicus]